MADVVGAPPTLPALPAPVCKDGYHCRRQQFSAEGSFQLLQSAGSTWKRGWKCQEVNDPGSSPQPGTNGNCWIKASFFTLRGDTSTLSAIQWGQAPITQSTHLPHNTTSIDLVSLAHFPILLTAASWELFALKSLSRGLFLGEPSQHSCWREADSILQCWRATWFSQYLGDVGNFSYSVH